MAIRNIVKIGDAILKKKSKQIDVFDERLFTLLDDMKDTLCVVEGLGLSAVQVGVLKRAFIVMYGDDYYEIINPRIIKTEGKCVDNEGCLSVIGFRGLVERAESVDLEYQDRHGEWKSLHAEGYFARVFLHEYDHLEGILFSDIMLKKIPDGETE